MRKLVEKLWVGVCWLASVLAAPVLAATVPVHGVAGGIVSLDYCADQYVIRFAPAEQIRGVSPDAVRAFSYLREAAEGLPQVRPVAEDVLLARPDLVVRSYGGGPGAHAFYQRLGIPVVQLGYAGSLQDIMDTVLSVSAALGNAPAGEAVVREMQRKLNAIRERLATAPASTGRRAMYMTAGGVTSGEGTLLHEVLLAAGLENFSRQPGWRALPLEQLAFDTPEVIATAFLGNLAAGLNTWSAARHPVAQDRLQDSLHVPLQGAWTSCGGWFVMDAIAALHEATLDQTQRYETPVHDASGDHLR